MSSDKNPSAQVKASSKGIFLSIQEVIELGVSRRWVFRQIEKGVWEARDMGKRDRGGNAIREVNLASLPHELFVKWLELHPPVPDPEAEAEAAEKAAEREQRRIEVDEAIAAAWMVLKDEAERDAYRREVRRLTAVVERYGNIHPKRLKDGATGAWSEFNPAILPLCELARCTDPIILRREPSRGQPPSPFTMDRWWREYPTKRELLFLPSPTRGRILKADDRRKSDMSPEAREWIEANWPTYASGTFRYFFKRLCRVADEQGWTVASETTLRRVWRELPLDKMTLYRQGKKAYTGKYADYTPRDYSDLDALQVVCGDHSQRDVVVSLGDGRIVRPWLTLWQDLRTGLIWGWHLALQPSSKTAALAYFNGARRWGAQPFQTSNGLGSFIYTDQGKDYKSHRWDGKEIAVHKKTFDGRKFEEVMTFGRVGFVDDLNVQHLTARGYNAREKVVERTHRDISQWEQDTFSEFGWFCGRDAKNKPDNWRTTYEQHTQAVKAGKPSPFILFDDYRGLLAGFIDEYNGTAHERSVLGGERIVPVAEYESLYGTRYEISTQALTLLLSNVQPRVVGKNGVSIESLQFNHPKLPKGRSIEVRVNEDDLTKVWCVLPDGEIVEAAQVAIQTVFQTKSDVGVVREAKIREKQLLRDAQELVASYLRGETTADRTGRTRKPEKELPKVVNGPPPTSTVHLMTRFDRKIEPAKPMPGPPVETTQTEDDEPILRVLPPVRKPRIKEFIGDDGDE